MIRRKIRKRIAELNKRGAIALKAENKTEVAETLIRMSECEKILKLMKK